MDTYELATVDGPYVICSYATYLMRCLEEQVSPTCLEGMSLDFVSACRQPAISDGSYNIPTSLFMARPVGMPSCSSKWPYPARPDVR